MVPELKEFAGNPAKPSAGLFDRIILAITQEKEFQKTKKLLIGFVSLLCVSLLLIPFSFMYLLHQWNSSHVTYFISIATENMNMFFALWQDILLSVLESLPLLSIFLFSINLALLVFTIRLFLYKKGLLLKYVRHNVSFA